MLPPRGLQVPHFSRLFLATLRVAGHSYSERAGRRALAFNVAGARCAGSLSDFSFAIVIGLQRGGTELQAHRRSQRALHQEGATPCKALR